MNPELEQLKKDLIQEFKKALLDVKQKKTGDSPLEAFDLVNMRYLQQHGARSTRPSSNLKVGQMFFNTSSAVANWWDGVNWRDGAGNIV